jgi:hypothetical protein
LLLLSSIFNKEFPVGITLLHDNLQGVDSNEKGHSDQLNALQALKQTVLEHHKRFTEETLNHIIYIDKKLTLRSVDTEDRLVAFFPAPCLEKIKALFF